MRFFTFLILLFAAFIPFKVASQSECTLPAPSKITILNQTPHLVEVEWTPVAGATGYRAVLDDGHTQIVNTISGGMNVTTEFNIEPGVDYDLWVYPICNEDEVSPNGIYLRIDGILIIVIDIVTSVHDNVPNAQNSGLLFHQSSLINGTAVNTGVCLDKKYDYFLSFNYDNYELPVAGKVTINSFDTSHVLTSRIYVPGESLDWLLEGVGNEPEPPGPPGVTSFEYAKYLPDSETGDYLKIEFKFDQFECKYMWVTAFSQQNGGISRIKNFSFYRSSYTKGVDQHSGPSLPDDSFLKAAPNPYSDQLNILFSGTPETPVSVSIFDINGRLLQSNTLKATYAGQQTFSIETADLPTGVHVVRIDTGNGNIQTFKMVKM